mmetsp:Transcript_161608/g.392422  ORF Transcript_161608/g.392422 Transcript_161608/m.392422 type:complete len:235 (-) Transcript_161608:219-923(-)
MASLARDLGLAPARHQLFSPGSIAPHAALPLGERPPTSALAIPPCAHLMTEGLGPLLPQLGQCLAVHRAADALCLRPQGSQQQARALIAQVHLSVPRLRAWPSLRLLAAPPEQRLRWMSLPAWLEERLLPRLLAPEAVLTYLLQVKPLETGEVGWSVQVQGQTSQWVATVIVAVVVVVVVAVAVVVAVPVVTLAVDPCERKSEDWDLQAMQRECQSPSAPPGSLARRCHDWECR